MNHILNMIHIGMHSLSLDRMTLTEHQARRKTKSSLGYWIFFMVKSLHVPSKHLCSDEPIEGLEYSLSDDTEIISLGVPLDLLDALIFPLSQDALYAKTFLATYRFFMPGKRVLDTLIEWYNVDLYEDCLQHEETFLKRNRKHIQSRAVKVLVLWIKNHWQDFADDPGMFKDLSEFVQDLAETNFGDNQKLNQAMREQVSFG